KTRPDLPNSPMFDLPPIPTGLHAIWADARQFLAGVRFARPLLLWLSLIPVALSVVAFLAARRQRNALARVGRPAAVFGLLTRPARPRRLGQLALLLAWTLLVLGAAGPRWGKGDDDGVAVGRDVVIVLDLSRSMLAADMSGPPQRWQAAVAGAQDLIESLRVHGGHRAAVVVFAAKPKLLVPLTTDYDHLQTKLAELDAAHLPPELRPDEGAKSGTRIGAALAAAVAAHDPRFPGYQDIILISDGDDPAGDREWAKGVSAARQASIPVHAVGVGDPDRSSPIFVNGRQLEFAGPDGKSRSVQTRLHEDVLKAIAEEGRGHYLPARREVPRLGEFFRTQIEPNPSRELTDDALPQPKDRSAWFFGFGLLCLAIGWSREK
ncbi:MAG TPA: VWA domain-containing protein, partial [Fimbriiglobus sp.]|nr:VWA domain-containing protein [Fimbriiglobus sp.]